MKKISLGRLGRKRGGPKTGRFFEGNAHTQRGEARGKSTMVRKITKG